MNGRVEWLHEKSDVIKLQISQLSFTPPTIANRPRVYVFTPQHRPYDRVLRLQSSNSGSLFQSDYASSFQQDCDFSTPYSARARMYDIPSSNTFGASHHLSSSSTSSLTGFGLGGGNMGHHHGPMTPMPSTSGDHRPNNANTNLIINYLPQDMNERELHSLFSAVGPVDTVRVMRDLKVSACTLSCLIKFSARRCEDWRAHSCGMNPLKQDKKSNRHRKMVDLNFNNYPRLSDFKAAADVN